jgi:proliferating cell nuclear antigen PCNA
MSLLKIKTKEGYTFKVLAELLNKCIKESCFIIKPTGIYLVGMDTKNKNGTKLVCLELLSEYFTIFKCNKPEIKVGLNLSHFYKMLKSIKKKDSLTLLIEESSPLDLKIIIHQNEDSNSTTSTIKISNVHPLGIEIPDGYSKPIITPSKEFQKIKTLDKISKYMKVTANPKTITFYCDKENLFDRKVKFGGSEDPEDEHDELEDDIYCQVFETEQILSLTKIAGLSQIVSIFPNCEFKGEPLPLKFKLNVGNLGTIEVYLKSKEQTERDNDSEEDEEKVD